MMAAVKNHWITSLTLFGVAFLLLISLTLLLHPDDGQGVSDRTFGAVFGLVALATLAGLWGLRSGRLELWAAHTMIVLGSIAVGMFFWMFLVPLIVALAILYAGVIRRGLQRELQLT